MNESDIKGKELEFTYDLGKMKIDIEARKERG
jgi:hypothetical protein